MTKENCIYGIDEFLFNLRDADFEQNDETKEMRESMISLAREINKEFYSKKLDAEKVWYILDIISTINLLIRGEDYEDVEWIYELIKDTYQAMLY